MPRCSRCGEDKPQSEYYRDGDVLRSECKACHDKPSKTDIGREARRQYMAAYRANNPEYRKQNIERSSERRRERKRGQ